MFSPFYVSFSKLFLESQTILKRARGYEPLRFTIGTFNEYDSSSDKYLNESSETANTSSHVDAPYNCSETN